jgi:excisionase family DNA binding protein
MTDHIRVGEAALRLGVHVNTIKKWVDAGILPAWRLPGGERRIPAGAVDSLLKCSLSRSVRRLGE